MVLEEIRYDIPSKPNDQKPPSSGGLKAEMRLASPVDRLAAVLADLVIFLPFMALVIAPLRKQALIAQLLGHEADWVSALVTTTSSGFLAFILFQTICVALWGATPGKLVFKLRVVSVWDGNKPRAFHAFMRAFAWALELLVFGAPWVAVFGNEKRRPFHDRVADTSVIVLEPKRAVGPPTLGEMSIASGVTAASLAAFSVFIIVTLTKLHSDMKEGAELASEMESKGLLCRTVGHAREDWMAGAERPSRLSVALSLYGSETIDETCLEIEADYAIWRNEDKTLAYLAKAFAHGEDQNLYDAYLDKVCELDAKSHACSLVSLVRFETNSGVEPENAEEKASLAADEHEIEQMITSTMNPPVYMKVWFIRHLMEKNRFAEALERIDEVSPHRSIGYYFARERTRALWGLDRRDDARLAMRSSIETLDTDQRVDLARWFCSSETAEEGCTEHSRFSCGLLGAAVERAEKWLANAEVAATYIRGETCRGDLTVDRLASLEEKMPGKDAKSFVKALRFLKSDQKEKAIPLLSGLATNEENQGPFFYEANVRLAELATTPKDLQRIKSAWLSGEPGEGWYYLGRQLAVRFNTLRAWDQTLEVGLKMVEADRFDKQLYRSLVVAAFRAGNQRMALGFLENLERLDQNRLERAPANFDDFTQVVQELLNRAKIDTKIDGKGSP